MSISGTAAGRQRPHVLADALPGRVVRDILLTIGFALGIGVAAQVAFPLPFTPVPVTGQTFAVLLGAAALGPGRALTGSTLYLAAGVAGVPWFAPANGASLGYVVGFVAASLLVGVLARAGNDRSRMRTIGMMAGGNAVIYAFGVPYLMWFAKIDLTTALALGVLPFLLGDALKILGAAAILPGAWRLVGSSDDAGGRS